MCDNETYSFPVDGGYVEVQLEFDVYSSNNSLAVLLWSRSHEEDISLIEGEWGDRDEDSFDELFCHVTVNLPVSGFLPFGEQFIDINNHPMLASWLEENKLATSVGRIEKSGYVSYPLFRFNIPADIIKILTGLSQK